MPITPVDRFAPVHSYRQIADDIARLIAAGQFGPKLPGERALAQEYEVAYSTVRRAMEVLREEGLIVTIHGHGTFVADNRG